MGRSVSGLWRHQKEIVLAPGRLHADDWVRWTPTIATALMLTVDRDASTSLDEMVSHEAVAKTTDEGREWSAMFGELGDPLVAGLAWGAAYGAAAASRKPEAVRTVRMTGEALVDSAILTQGMKLALGRGRPRAEDSDGSYVGGPAHLGLGMDSGSMPSGHAMAAFAVATVVAERNPERKWVAPLAYSLAGAVAASRVYDEHHYLSDVLVGGLIGHGVGRLVVRRHHADPERPSKWSMTILPSISMADDSVGISVALHVREPAWRSTQH
jgi:membrane-associated phospholipid phosphatase